MLEVISCIVDLSVPYVDYALFWTWISEENDCQGKSDRHAAHSLYNAMYIGCEREYLSPLLTRQPGDDLNGAINPGAGLLLLSSQCAGTLLTC